MDNLRRAIAAAAGVFLLTLCTAPGATAQESTIDYGRGGFEVNAFGGVVNPSEPQFGPGEAGFTLQNGPTVGGRLGYVFPNNLFLEGEISHSWLKSDVQFTQHDLKALMYGGVLGYNLQVAPDFQLFLAAGAGQIRWNPDQFSSSTDFQWSYGGGARVFFTPSFALRVDLRSHVAPKQLSAYRRQLQPGLKIDENSAQNFEISAGFSAFLGGKRDSDHDGVTDAADACPNTPRGVNVTADGCPTDADADNVPDYLDKCPGTPKGAKVDAKGCPTDQDQDGVFDGIDQCPNTPQGAKVDDKGCPTDSDNDGVYDGIDQCAATPAGATVDAKGCPTDSDNDGVYDGIDQCPNTPQGAKVDDKGCQVSQVEEQLRQTGKVVLHNVYFDLNKATLRPESKPTLNEVGQALVNNPQLKVEIQGHTDSTGPKAYNEKLSQRRAESVRSYLLSNFPKLDPSNLTARGYGESEPIASNATAEGRQQNRRVEFVVTGGD